MRKFVYISFFQIFIVAIISPAQIHPVFHHLNTSDGLSNNRVRCIMQDSQGFMWFGTDAGLNRYDGKEFLIYKNIAGDSTSISGNEVHDLLEDKNGILWIATGDGGLSSYNYQSGKFKQYKIKQSGGDAALANAINTIEIDLQNNFWVGTDKAGLYLFDKEKRTFQLQSQTMNSGVHKHSTNKAYSYYDIVSDENNIAYFGTLGYSLELFSKGKIITTYAGKAHPFPAQAINCIFIDSKKRVWMGAWDNALHQYDIKNNSISSIQLKKDESFSFSDDEIISINENKDGCLWLGTRKNGLYIFNPQNDSVINLKKDQHNAGAISSNAVRCIFRDQQNRMWLGTDAGIDVFDPLLHQFDVVYLDKIISDATDDEIVYDFLEEGTVFYIATSKGLLIRKNPGEKYFRRKFNYLNENLSITKLYKDKRGRIFIGTNKTLFIFNPDNYSIKTVNCFFKRSHDLFDFYNIESSRIVSIAESNWKNHDVIWTAPYGHGIGVFDSENLSGFESVLNIPDDMENLIRRIFVDSKNKIWLMCGTKGISYGIDYPNVDTMNFIFSKKNSLSKTVSYEFKFLQSKYISHDEKNPLSLGSNNVFDMIENADNTFWVTSNGGGLQLFSPEQDSSSFGKRGAFKSFPCDHPDKRGMVKDKNGNLWIIVSGGIEFFDVQKKQFHHFGFKEGIPNEGLRDYFYSGKDGYAYAGGNGYFIKFKLEEIQFNKTPPEMAITHFKIFDQPADSLLMQKEINLSYKNNFFSFEFAALNFTDADANQFAYKLNGVDNDWVHCGRRNFASYTNLRGGHYIFQVKAANNNDVWNETGISIPVYIKPPLWQYEWFYPSLILLFAAAGFFIYRNRANRIHKQQEEKLRTEIEAQERERVRIAQDLHDDFGTRISALKIYMSTLEKHLDAKSEEAKSVKESAKSIVNDAMTDLRTLLMNLSPKTLEMHGYHAAVHDLVSRLNHTGMFEVELDVPSSLQRFEKKYELALYRITQELLNNSIKHAQCSEISIQLLKRSGELILTYSDNGKGFDKSQQKEKGFGLINIENRVHLINGKINWDSQQGRGVNVIVEIPFIN